MRKFSLGLDARKKKYETEGIDGYDWNEAQPKWPITRIMNTAFGIISVIVWILILTRIFASGNSEYEKMILLNEKAAAPPGLSACRQPAALRLSKRASVERPSFSLCACCTP